MANILDVLKVIDKYGTEYAYNPGGLKCEVQKYRGDNQDHTFTKEGAVAYVSETAKYYASSDKSVVVGGGSTVTIHSSADGGDYHCLFFGYW